MGSPQKAGWTNPSQDWLALKGKKRKGCIRATTQEWWHSEYTCTSIEWLQEEVCDNCILPVNSNKRFLKIGHCLWRISFCKTMAARLEGEACGWASLSSFSEVLPRRKCFLKEGTCGPWGGWGHSPAPVSPGCQSLHHPKELREAGSVFKAWRQNLGDTSAKQDVANKKGIIWLKQSFPDSWLLPCFDGKSFDTSQMGGKVKLFQRPQNKLTATYLEFTWHN